MSLVGIVIGSDSDLPTVRHTVNLLREFGVPFQINVISAHRSPHAAQKYAAEAQGKGFDVIIAAAGGAAHLAGTIAAMTTLPVIGVPINSSALNGVDSLYSTVQMPAGVPVATMAIGEAGAKNAAVFAAEILALRDEEIRKKMQQFKERMAREVGEKDSKVKKEFAGG